MTLNKYLRYFILAGLFAVPFIPLVVSSGMFFPFITGKNFAFRIIIELILVAWVVLAIREPEYRPKKSIILIAFAVFIAVIAVADVFGENFYRSFWSNYERMEGLIAHLHLFAYFLVVAATLATEKLWQRFFYTSFGVNIAILGYSFLQLSGKLAINQGGVRVDGTLGNATYLAVYLLFQIFLATFFLVRANSKESKNDRSIFPLVGLGVGILVATYSLSAPLYIYFLAVIAIAVAAFPIYFIFGLWGGRPFLYLLILADLFVLYRTETRGAILGLIAGVVLTSILLAVGNWNDKKTRNIAVGVFLAMAIFIGLFISFREASFIRNSSTLSRFASISFTEQTTRSRFTIWNMSFEGFKERPALGWGQDNFIDVFGKYYEPSMWSQESWFDRSHNVFFDWLIAGGLMGLLAYLSLFGAGIYVLWKSRRFSFSEKSILSGLFAGYFFQNLFVFDNLTSYLAFFSLLGFVSVLGGTEEASVANSTHKKAPLPAPRVFSDASSYAIISVVLVCAVFVIYFANIKPIIVSNNLISALRPQEEGLTKNLGYFKNIFTLNTFGSGEAREQLVQIVLRLRDADQKIVTLSDKQDFFNLAREQMLIQISMAPTDVRYELFMGSFLDSYGMYDEALKHLARAVELSPKKQPVLFEIASAYINKGDPVSALPYLKQAYDDAPEYPEAIIMYATGLIYSGNEQEAEAIFKQKYGTILIPDNRIVGAYNYRRMYDKAIAIRKEQLSKSPGDLQAGISLVAEYLKAEQRGNAVSELKRMVSQNPSFKDQGQYYIEEIEAGRNP